MPFLNRQFIIVVAVALLAFACYYPFSPMRRQQVGMRQAAQLQARIQLRLTSVAAFREVKLPITTRPGLIVRADLSSQDDVNRLVSIVREEYQQVEHVPAVTIALRLNDAPVIIDPLPSK